MRSRRRAVLMEQQTNEQEEESGHLAPRTLEDGWKSHIDLGYVVNIYPWDDRFFPPLRLPGDPFNPLPNWGDFLSLK